MAKFVSLLIAPSLLPHEVTDKEIILEAKGSVFLFSCLYIFALLVSSLIYSFFVGIF